MSKRHIQICTYIYIYMYVYVYVYVYLYGQASGVSSPPPFPPMVWSDAGEWGGGGCQERPATCSGCSAPSLIEPKAQA